MKSINKKTISTLLSSIGIMAAAFPKSVYAQSGAWTGVCVSQTDTDVATIQGLQCLLARLLSFSLTLLGIVGFVMLVFGSLRWLTSGGNAQAVEKSGKTMVFAFAGLLLALSSFVILNLIAKFTGVNSILNFVIPDSTTNW